MRRIYHCGMERKLAAVLFIDLVDSTEFLADADPEVVRRRVSRYFDQVSHCIVTHGGTVEKFAGDAVMAAFGIPLAHEDDAERAVRAGLATLERVKELGLVARVGIESGEVVADESESTFATGEAVNLAARLQGKAEPNQILVGPAAARLLRGRVELEPIHPLELRGWREPVAAQRVVCVPDPGVEPVTGLSAPLVGRESELELLENTYERAVRAGRASLVTVYGDPGVGKSRLAREFVAGLEGATVLSGRCLPYGEGVTYWPLAEMVKASSGISDDDPLDDAHRKLRDCCEDEAVADLLGLAVGVLEAVEGERSQQDISWAARAWAEQLAQAQPLVLLFEDVHWGEEPLLELIEQLASSVRDAPLLLLALARPELIDLRPTWGGGRVRSTTLELEPLQAEESAELVAKLTADLDLPLDVATVLAKTEGNPLFVEETVRMLAEHPRSGERIPDTLQALIAARIDRLPAAQRVALQRASVMGRIFMRGALAHLSPEIDDVGHCVDELLLRDLVVREPRATISGEEAYKFKHVLIREVAYSALSKGARADLHHAFAEWLAQRAGDELLEIRAFHLDQATTLLAELDGAAPAELREETAQALAHAGRRALSREAFRSARKLLLRAVELAPTLERRYFAGRAAWRLADFPAVVVEMGEVADEAARSGERRLQGRALTALAEAVLQHRADAVTARKLVAEAVEVLDGEHPEILFEPLWVSAQVAQWLGDSDEFERWAKAALAAAREAERKDLEALVVHGLVSAYVLRLELGHAAPLVLRALELADASGSLFSRASALGVRGWLQLVSECPAEAEADYTAARELFAEVGNTRMEAVMVMMTGRAAFAQGDTERAEKHLRDAVRSLKGLGDRGSLCEAQRALSMVLSAQGRFDEAERLALEARETVGPDDRVSLSTTSLALGIVRAGQHRDAEAEQLMREAVDGFLMYGIRALEHWALRYLVEFLRSRGRDDEAALYEERRASLAPESTAPIV
jgi:class 3 adenylate cyclase/tetratricopeptide (TPR) repeat protein